MYVPFIPGCKSLRRMSRRSYFNIIYVTISDIDTGHINLKWRFQMQTRKRQQEVVAPSGVEKIYQILHMNGALQRILLLTTIMSLKCKH